jgi:hypothetical protein
VHTLEAALWCVGHAADFQEAVLLAANLADDADTVAAVTGQIAGALLAPLRPFTYTRLGHAGRDMRLLKMPGRTILVFATARNAGHEEELIFC